MPTLNRLLGVAAILGLGTLLLSLNTVSQISPGQQQQQQQGGKAVTFSSSPPPPPLQQLKSAATPRSCAPLDAALVQAAASGNAARIVFVTFVNHAQLDFGLNWIAHLDEVGLADSALVGATDQTTLRGLEAPRRARARCFPLQSEIGAVEAKWGSPGFSQMGRTKARLLRTLLGFGATVFFADADVAVLRNPLPYLTAQLDAPGAPEQGASRGLGRPRDRVHRRPEHFRASPIGGAAHGPQPYERDPRPSRRPPRPLLGDALQAPLCGARRVTNSAALMLQKLMWATQPGLAPNLLHGHGCVGNGSWRVSFTR